uniref:SMP domain-containing protein n=1 Tax=Aegilops tauschii subsp. strangulata TaxID=200361 RepID=A0A453LSS0_AEGTS
MSQGQPRRPEGGEAMQADRPIKYGDVFDVSGELAAQPVAPRDAAMLQSAENEVLGLGQTQKGGPAAVMQSAATLNARAGHVGRGQLTGPVADAGVTVTEADLPGRRVITESVAGQVVGRFVAPAPVTATEPSGALDQDAVTIGRALEAVAAAGAGAKPEQAAGGQGGDEGGRGEGRVGGDAEQAGPDDHAGRRGGGGDHGGAAQPGAPVGV